MNPIKLEKLSHILGGILLVTILFLPDIHLKSSLPAIQIVDLLLPLVGMLLLVNRQAISKTMYWLIPLVFCLYIPVTMFINGRSHAVSDYFEIYKLIKFVMLILFFSLLDYRTFAQQWFKPIFLVLVTVNLLHFFNVFGINTFLYDIFGGIHLEYFGLNSLKEPATKRMIGLATNPNINAVVFAFFGLYFLPLKFDSRKLFWFTGAILLMLLCQSRTSIVALGIVLLAILVFRLSDWNVKRWGIVVGSLIGLYLLAWALTTNFFTYQSYSNNVVSNSAMGRLETWAYLFDMIKERPIFGYGVNKQYFYDRELYSENEYILMWWRYGIIGLLLYLAMFFTPMWHYFKQRTSGTITRHGFIFLVFIMVVALANNPYQDRIVMVLIALMLGLTSKLLRKRTISED